MKGPYKVVHHLGEKGGWVYSVMRDDKDYPLESFRNGAKAERLRQQLAFAFSMGSTPGLELARMIVALDSQWFLTEAQDLARKIIAQAEGADHAS